MFGRVYAAIAINKGVPCELLREPDGIRTASCYWLTKSPHERGRHTHHVVTAQLSDSKRFTATP